MTHYDETILQSFAERLYRRADWVLVKCIVLGILFGVAIGVIAGYASERFDRRGSGADKAQEATVAFVFLGGVVGGVIGNSKAFEYQLRAQAVLCLMQIERNTRKETQAGGSA